MLTIQKKHAKYFAFRREKAPVESGLKVGFPLGEIFRSNRNFYCSNSKDRRLVPSECLSDKRKFRFGRKIPPRGIGPLGCHSTQVLKVQMVFILGLCVFK